MRRIALYSQDTSGLGRLRRNVAIARALRADGRAILLISGAGEAALVGLPEGADTLVLPALDDGGASARSLGIGTEALVRLRAETLRRALEAFRPDALVVDRLPAGIEGELRPSLPALRRMRTRLVLGLPDVLGDRARVREDWRRTDALQLVRDRYHRVWVYGDRKVFDPLAEHGLARELGPIARYTGYLDGAEADPAARATALRGEHRLGDGPLCVCLADGGCGGAALAAAFARAPLPPGTTGVVLTGPFMAAERVAELEAAARGRDDLRVIRVLPAAATLVRIADRVIAMGGYHTTAEALAAGRRALLVPSPQDRPDQLIRARRLRDRGAADLLEPAALSPDALAAWIARPAGAPPRSIRTDGLARLPLLLHELAAPAGDPEPRFRRRGRGSRPAVATSGRAAAMPG
jgi:predicted glycosyltransferase